MTYPITGILQGRGPAPNQVPVRQEIDTWYTDPANIDQVNLFLLALANFQQMPVEDMKSYYQVCGIHGLPLVPFDEDTKSKTPGSINGYCTHNSILFPGWHRPYILLFEQRLYEIMIQTIIPTFPSSLQPQLTTAASAFRFPYWDWSLKKSRDGSDPDYQVPLIVLPKTIQVQSPTGPRTIDNPMYAFRTKKPMGDYGVNRILAVDGIPYDKCMATSRCPPRSTNPVSTVWIQGIQNNDQVAQNIRDNEGGTDPLAEAVYRLFSEDYFENYDAFASTRYTEGQPPPDYLSCEGIHNNIHVYCGGENEGHMSNVPVAAFDPIFWLHHCNVDRLFAIWQTLNPQTWFSSRSQQLTDPSGNWSTRPGTLDKPTTPLAPFHTDTKGTTYTSHGVRDWVGLGYTYPELQPWLAKYVVNGEFSESVYLEDVGRMVNELYSSTRSAILLKTPKEGEGAEGAGAQQVMGLVSEENDRVSHDDYVVNVMYKKFALGGSPFTIHISIGTNQSTKVGTIYNFSTPAHATGGPDGCDNCRRQEEEAVLATSQVPITNALLRDIEDEGKPLGTLKPEEVEAYLKENLHWKVTKAMGVEVELPAESLKVSLAVGKGTHWKDEKRLSRYGDYRVLYPVTEGRHGGLGRNDPHCPK